MTYRPAGVVVLAIFFLIFAVLGIILILFLEADLVATTVQTSSFNALLSIIVNLQYGVPLGDALLFATIYVSSAESGLVYYHTGAVIATIFVAVYLSTAIGLLMMKKWGYYLALTIGIITLISGILGLGLGIYIIIALLPDVLVIVFGIYIVAYLMGDVQYEFN
jgi:hypothetical protein